MKPEKGKDKYLVNNKKQNKSLFNQLQLNIVELQKVIKKNNITEIKIFATVQYFGLVEDQCQCYYYLELQSNNNKLMKMIIKNCTLDIPITDDTRLKNLNLENFSIDCSKYVKAELERYFLRSKMRGITIQLESKFEPLILD